MPGIIPIVGRTKQEASEKLQKYNRDAYPYTHIDVAIGAADRWLGSITDLRSVNLDALVPESLPPYQFPSESPKYAT